MSTRSQPPSLASPIIRVGHLAQALGAELIGDPSVEISGAATLSQAKPGEVSFLENPAHLGQLALSQASAFVVPPGVVAQDGRPCLCVKDVHNAFLQAAERFRPTRQPMQVGISPQAVVDPSAKVGQNVNIHPFVTVGQDVILADGVTLFPGVHVMAGCQLGEGVVVYPNAVLYPETIIGARAIIHAGAVLGGYGFGYRQEGGRHVSKPQLGWVELGAEVEIGALTTVDRGTFGPTTVGEGTKIDNLVMIAHNCQIGRHNLLCSQVGIAGSSTTGDYVVMAGQCGIADHLNIGHQAVLGAMSGIMSDIPDGSRVVGIPATPERDQKILHVALRKLPEMRQTLKELQQTVAQIKTAVEQGRAA